MGDLRCVGKRITMELLDRKKKFVASIVDGLLFVATYPFRALLFGTINVPSAPSSFLIVRLDHVGDVILSTPVYHSIKLKYPHSTITVLCGSWAREILSSNPYVDNLLVIDCPWWTKIRSSTAPRNFFRELIRMIRFIRGQKFQVFIDLRGDMRQIFLFGWLTGIDARISYDRTGGGALLTHCYPYPIRAHEIERNYGLLRLFAPMETFLMPEIYSSEYSEGLASKLEGLIDIGRDKYCVVFNGGRTGVRRISSLKLLNLCGTIIDELGCKCCFVGDKMDCSKGENIKRLLGSRSHSFINLCGQLNFLEINELIKRASVFVGTDSSVMHLSSSTSTPAVVLFGPLNPEQTRPLGKNNTVIYHKYPCSPCLQDRCVVTKTIDHAQCMEDISVREIIDGMRHHILLPNSTFKFVN
jgi:ADP-heptose:LPS heptosyltransferase